MTDEKYFEYQRRISDSDVEGLRQILRELNDEDQNDHDVPALAEQAVVVRSIREAEGLA